MTAYTGLADLDIEAAEDFVAACLEPFSGEQLGKKPQGTCRDCTKGQCSRHVKQWCETCKQNITTAHIHLDFVGHAHLTARLLQLDPFWSWEPVAFDEDGLPKIKVNGGQAHLWIRLTVAGITRLGVGSEPVEKFGKPNENLLKELIGDALRNAGMRFGLALNLWAKGELLEDAEEPPTGEPPAADSKPAAAKQAQPAKKAATAPRRGATAPAAKKAAQTRPPAKKAATAPPGPAATPEAADGGVEDPNLLFKEIPKEVRQKAMAALAENPVEVDEYGQVALWPFPSDKTRGENGELLSAEALEFVTGEAVDVLRRWAAVEGIKL